MRSWRSLQRTGEASPMTVCDICTLPINLEADTYIHNPILDTYIHDCCHLLFLKDDVQAIFGGYFELSYVTH